MSINDPYTALKYILQNNTVIASKLSKYTDGITPLISHGEIEEVEKSLPCIVFNDDNLLPNRSIEDVEFTVNCYAETKRASSLLARTILKELNGVEEYANGYPVTITCSILTSIPDPAAKEVNTAVAMRLYNINGGA